MWVIDLDVLAVSCGGLLEGGWERVGYTADVRQIWRPER